MSEYFQVLNRLREEGSGPRLGAVPRPAAAPPQPTAAATPVAAASAARVEVAAPQPAAPPAPPPPTAAAVSSPPPIAEPSRPATASKGLPPSAMQDVIDTLQRIRTSGRTRCLVLAPASGGEDAETFAAQVVRLLHERGIAGDALRLRDASAASGLRSVGALAELALDFSDPGWCEQLRQWQAARPQERVSLIIAPPLSYSRAAALAARECDGLTLLVELRTTQRKPLAQAVKRAEEIGCTVLGLIVVGSEDLPGWARRIRKSFW